VLKVKVKVKGHVIRTLFWIIGMSYSVIDGLVFFKIAIAACHTSEFWQVHLSARLPRRTGYDSFFDINISQGSVATRLR